MVSDLIARAGREYSEMLSERSIDSSLSESELAGIALRAITLGISEDTEGLLDVHIDGDEPAVTRYDIKAIMIAVVGLVGGSQGGVVGALVALAGLWELWGFRERLSPSVCILIGLLSDAENATVRSDQLEVDFSRSYFKSFGRLPMSSEFAALLVDLESKDVVQRNGAEVHLKEVHFVRHNHR